MGHQGSSVGLLFDVDVRRKLQARHAGAGAPRPVLGEGRVRRLCGGRREVWGVDGGFGGERRGGREEVWGSVVGRRVDRGRRLEGRQRGVVRGIRGGEGRGKRRGWREEEQAGANGLAGAVVHLHPFVLLPLFVLLLLFLLHFFDLQLLGVDFRLLLLIWTETERERARERTVLLEAIF